MDSMLYDPAADEYGIITYDELFSYITYGRGVLPKAGQLQLTQKVGNKRKTKKQPKNAQCPHCTATLESSPDFTPEQGIYGGSDTVIFRGHSKVFNMWSQVARTVILAFIKKEGRDKKNSGSYRDHLTSKIDPTSERLKRFFTEADDICKYNDDFRMCLESLLKISETDERPHDGLIGKLVATTGLSRSQVSTFIRMLRLRSSEFSDSPQNYSKAQLQERKRFTSGAQGDED
jgi:hypothetical protein